MTLALFSAAEASDSASATGSSDRGVAFRWRVWTSRVSSLWSVWKDQAAKRSVPSAAQRTAHAVAPPEIVEMGDRLAHREEALLQVERAAEQHRHHLRGRHRRAGRGDRLLQARPAARRDARAAARRAAGCRGTAARATAAPARRRAAPRTRRASRRKRPSGSPSGSRRPHADVGADLRQQHVAGDQDVARRGEQRRVLRRMAVADDDLPRACRRRSTRRRRAMRSNDGGALRHAAPVVVAARRERARRPSSAMPCARNSAQVSARAVRGALVDDRVRGQELAVRHRHRAAEALRQPRGVAEVVGMAVRGDDARERACRRIVVGEMRLPQRARRRVAVAAVDQRPAVVFLEQPQVDVVERERQRHAQPVNAGRDVDGRARRRRRGERVVEDGGMRGGHGGTASGQTGMVSWTGSRTLAAARHSVCDRMPAATRKPLRDARPRAHLLDLRPRARVRAHHARHPLLRGRGHARARSGAAAPAIYRERERVRLKLILRGKRLGFSLLEIRELLDLYEVGRNERAQLAMFIEMLGERRARLLQQKEDIDAVLAEIDGVERDCRRRLEGRARQGRRPGGAPPDDASRRSAQLIDVYVNVIQNTEGPCSPDHDWRVGLPEERRSRCPCHLHSRRCRLRGARARELRPAGRDDADRRAARRGRARLLRDRAGAAARSRRSSTATCMRASSVRSSIRPAAMRASRCFPADSSVLTVEFKLNLLAPAEGERLIAEGFVVKPGRTLVDHPRRSPRGARRHAHAGRAHAADADGDARQAGCVSPQAVNAQLSQERPCSTFHRCPFITARRSTCCARRCSSSPRTRSRRAPRRSTTRTSFRPTCGARWATSGCSASPSRRNTAAPRWATSRIASRWRRSRARRRRSGCPTARTRTCA